MQLYILSGGSRKFQLKGEGLRPKFAPFPPKKGEGVEDPPKLTFYNYIQSKGDGVVTPVALPSRSATPYNYMYDPIVPRYLLFETWCTSCLVKVQDSSVRSTISHSYPLRRQRKPDKRKPGQRPRGPYKHAVIKINTSKTK